MIAKLFVVAMAAGLVSACAPSRPIVVEAQPVRTAQAPQPDYVWARNDGQRMAGNPTLYAKGQADQNRCRQSSTISGMLDQPAFVRCMESSGYTARSG